jgi:uncharacterized protein (DUF983 family)
MISCYFCPKCGRFTGGSVRRAPNCTVCGSEAQIAGTALLGLAVVFVLLSALSLALMDLMLFIAILLGIFGVMRCVRQFYVFRKSKNIVG